MEEAHPGRNLDDDSQGTAGQTFHPDNRWRADKRRDDTFLKDLKRHLSGKKLLLIWDGLPAHRSKKVVEYVKMQSAWLRTARLPAYAPEVNPIEYCWGAMKKKHLGNLRAEGMEKLGHAVRKAKRAMNDNELLKGFLKASGLY